jgi:hypothetical protein
MRVESDAGRAFGNIAPPLQKQDRNVSLIACLNKEKTERAYRLGLNLLFLVRPAPPGYKETPVGQIEPSMILVYRVLDTQWAAPV